MRQKVVLDDAANLIFFYIFYKEMYSFMFVFCGHLSDCFFLHLMQQISGLQGTSRLI